jgi:hypothetical protein
MAAALDFSAASSRSIEALRVPIGLALRVLATEGGRELEAELEDKPDPKARWPRTA